MTVLDHVLVWGLVSVSLSGVVLSLLTCCALLGQAWPALLIERAHELASPRALAKTAPE